MINQEQIDYFAENGYLRYGKVLEEEEVEALRAALDNVIAVELAGGDDSEIEFKFGHRRGDESGDETKKPRILTQYVNMWKREPIYERLIHHPEIAGAACALLESPRVRLWHDHIISKPPRDNGHFRYHQDFYNWPLLEPRIVTCWIALDDATPENGCMHVVPGSHRDPRFGLASYAAELEARAAAEADGREWEESERQKMAYEPAAMGRPVALKAGECMFHHSLNFHATPANLTERQRRAHVIIYMAEGARVRLDQAPTHPLIPNFTVKDGEELLGSDFPLARPDEKIWRAT